MSCRTATMATSSVVSLIVVMQVIPTPHVVS